MSRAFRRPVQVEYWKLYPCGAPEPKPCMPEGGGGGGRVIALDVGVFGLRMGGLDRRQSVTEGRLKDLCTNLVYRRT